MDFYLKSISSLFTSRRVIDPSLEEEGNEINLFLVSFSLTKIKISSDNIGFGQSALKNERVRRSVSRIISFVVLNSYNISVEF